MADTKEQSVVEKYQNLLKSYEDDLAELKRKENEIPKEDVVTVEDERRALKNHFEEEQALERRVGKKYLTKIDSETDILGSTLESVNRRLSEESAIEDWVSQVQAEAKQAQRGGRVRDS